MSILLLLGDAVVLTLYALYSSVTYLPEVQGREIPAHFYGVEALLLAAWLLAALGLKITRAPDDLRRMVLRVGLGWTVVYVFLYVVEFVVKTILMAPAARPGFSVFGLGFGWASGLVMLLAWRLGATLWLKALSVSAPDWLRKLARGVTALALLIGLGIAVLEGVTLTAAVGRVYTVERVPAGTTAVVFGAGVWPDGEPSNVLKDRVRTACDLYKTGKVKRIIFSGGSAPGRPDEPAVMRDLAVNVHGTPAEALSLDPSGARTYDTCLAAKETFGVDQAILVTNRYHAARALLTCRRLGVESTVVTADIHTYPVRSEILWNLREVPATVMAWLGR